MDTRLREKVLAKMTADRKLQPEPRGILLIAPTTSIVSKLAFQTDPASSISSMESLNVVHGIYDTAFCPHQTRWADENLYRLQDDHVLLLQSLLATFSQEPGYIYSE